MIECIPDVPGDAGTVEDRELRTVVFVDGTGLIDEAVSPVEGRDRLAAHLYCAWRDAKDHDTKEFFWTQLTMLNDGLDPTAEQVRKYVSMGRDATEAHFTDADLDKEVPE